jgi:hypothetical protein
MPGDFVFVALEANVTVPVGMTMRPRDWIGVCGGSDGQSQSPSIGCIEPPNSTPRQRRAQAPVKNCGGYRFRRQRSQGGEPPLFFAQWFCSPE